MRLTATPDALPGTALTAASTTEPMSPGTQPATWKPGRKRESRSMAQVITTK